VVAQLAAEVPFGGSATGYGFTQPAVTTSLPTGVGTSRTTQTLSGFFGGIMTPRGGGGNTPYVLTGATGVATTPADSRVSAVFAGSDPFTSSTSGTQSVVLAFGDLSGRPYGRVGFIDDSHFAALESANTPSQFNATVLPTPQNGVSTSTSPRLAMVTSDTVPSTAVLPQGVSYCQCQFLQWGYWTGDFGLPNSSQ